jgi:hypothetical protein
VQKFTDGHIVVIGHHYQEEALVTPSLTKYIYVEQEKKEIPPFWMQKFVIILCM